MRNTYHPLDVGGAQRFERAREIPIDLPPRYRLVETRAYPGTDGVVVTVYAARPSP